MNVLRNTWCMYMGVDIGATKTLIATSDSRDPQHEFIEQKKFPTPSDFDTFIEHLRSHLRDCIHNQSVTGVVVAAPGTVRNGMLHSGGNITWQDVDILACVRGDIGDVPAELLNDAAVAGLYEARHGSGRHYDIVTYLTISTGIGSSIIVNKQLLGNFANSEGGRIVLDWNSDATFESVASGKAFVERYGHQGKDETDARTWEEYGRAAGTGIFSVITLIRPSIVVIGGSMGAHFDKYERAVRERVATLAQGAFEVPDISAAHKPATAVAHGCIDRAREIAHA